MKVLKEQCPAPHHQGDRLVETRDLYALRIEARQTANISKRLPYVSIGKMCVACFRAKYGDTQSQQQESLI